MCHVTATGRVLHHKAYHRNLPGSTSLLQPRDYNILFLLPSDRCLERRGFVRVENQSSEEPDHLHKVFGTDTCPYVND